MASSASLLHYRTPPVINLRRSGKLGSSPSNSNPNSPSSSSSSTCSSSSSSSWPCCQGFSWTFSNCFGKFLKSSCFSFYQNSFKLPWLFSLLLRFSFFSYYSRGKMSQTFSQKLSRVRLLFGFLSHIRCLQNQKHHIIGKQYFVLFFIFYPKLVTNFVFQ